MGTKGKQNFLEQVIKKIDQITEPGKYSLDFNTYRLLLSIVREVSVKCQGQQPDHKGRAVTVRTTGY